MKRAGVVIVAVGLAALGVYLPSGGSTAGAAPPPLAAKGKKLYASYSCDACHTIDGRGGAGPTFKHLYGSRVKLKGGKTVLASDAYLIRSIEDPNAQIVAGRPSGVMTMTIKKGMVPRKDTLALVAFIKSLK